MNDLKRSAKQTKRTLASMGIAVKEDTIENTLVYTKYLKDIAARNTAPTMAIEAALINLDPER